MTPQEEQDYLDNRFADEDCDDCGQGADGHSVGIGPSGKPFVECNDD